jgi:hypothetical protein
MVSFIYKEISFLEFFPSRPISLVVSLQGKSWAKPAEMKSPQAKISPSLGGLERPPS